ncbi:hypothetical protein CULT_1490010 [[Clostridium] ultunense Esp]|nr:hypothetical protein CULT_1490010 [[Clostridium] ultunense Esp]
MSNIIYFQPKEQRNPLNKMIFKLVPRNSSEAYKADVAEKVLSGELYIYYLALVLIHKAYHLVPERHQVNIKRLVDIGVLDELAIIAEIHLTNSCVTSEGKFVFNGKEFELPKGYIPKLRIVDQEGNIYVEAFNGSRRRIYEFIYYKSGYRHIWLRVDDKIEKIIETVK